MNQKNQYSDINQYSLSSSFLCVPDPLSSIQFRWVPLVSLSDSLWSHGLQHTRLPCSSRTPGAYSNSCALSWWCHPTISSSVVPFSFCPQSFPEKGSFPVSQLFASGGQSIGASASTSVLPMHNQDWSPLGWTGWISLESKGLSRVSCNATDNNWSLLRVVMRIKWSHVCWVLHKTPDIRAL